jgi:hypothetical protein
MRWTRLILAAAALSGLAGCMSTAEIRAADENRCAGYGFRPGTDAYSKCLQNIDLDRSADRRAVLYGGPGPGFGMGFGYGVGWRRW